MSQDQSNNAVLASSVGLGLTGGKLMFDANRLGKKLDNFEETAAAQRRLLRPYTDSAGQMAGHMDPVLGYRVPMSLSDAERAVEGYAHGASELARARVLGIPGGRTYQALIAAKPLVTTWPATPFTAFQRMRREGGITYTDALKRQIAENKAAWKYDFSPEGYVTHMGQYSSPKVGLGGLKVHELHNVLGNDTLAGLPEGIAKLVDDATVPIVQKVEALESGQFGSVGHDIAMKIRRGLLGGPGHMKDFSQFGRAVRMMGDRIHVVGQAEAYRAGLTPAAKLLKKLGLVGLVAGGTGALRAGWQGLQQRPVMVGVPVGPVKRASQQQRDSKTNDILRAIAGSGMTGAGALLAPAAIEPWKNPNRSIRTTYGAMSGDFGGHPITAGHRNPAQAIEEILREAQQPGQEGLKTPYVKGSEKFTVGPSIVREQGGLLSDPHAQPNVLVETGFGASQPPRNSWNEAKQIHEGHVSDLLPAHERVKPQSLFSYLTDSIADKPRPGAGWNAGATMRSNERGKLPKSMQDAALHFLTYGNNTKEHADYLARNNPKDLPITQAYAGPGVTPAIKQPVLDALMRPVEKDQVLDELAQFYNGKGNADIAQQLAGAKGKHIIVASGSSRGDFVAAKAKYMQEALLRAGVDPSRIQVIAQMGEAFTDPLQRKLLENSGVIQLPGMALPQYVGLQNVADWHLGSTGASAAAEAAIQKSPYSFHPDQGKWETEVRPGTLAHRMRDDLFPHWLDSHGNHPDRGLMEKLFAVARTNPQGHGFYEHGDKFQDKGMFQRFNNFIQSGENRLFPVADWNEGNVDAALKHKGFLPENYDVIANLFKNPEELAKLQGAARERSTGALQELLASRHNTAKMIFGEAGRNVRNARIHGTLASALGLGLLGGGAKMLFGDSSAKPIPAPAARPAASMPHPSALAQFMR